MAKKHAFQANSLISFPQIGRVSIYLFIIQGLRHSDWDQEKCNYNKCMCQSVPSPNVVRLWALVLLIGGERGQDLQEDQKWQIKMCQN